MAISGTKGQMWRAIPTQYRKASDILTSTLATFLLFIQQPPKKGKGSRGSFSPLGKLARRAIYFTDVFSLFFF